MRVTIVKDDNSVYVGGVCRTVDCSKLPADFHALQWGGTHGEVEYRAIKCEHCGVRSKKGNVTISDLSPYQSYVDAWKVEDARVRQEETDAKAALEAEQAAKLEAANAAGPKT